MESPSQKTKDATFALAGGECRLAARAESGFRRFRLFFQFGDWRYFGFVLPLRRSTASVAAFAPATITVTASAAGSSIFQTADGGRIERLIYMNGGEIDPPLSIHFHDPDFDLVADFDDFIGPPRGRIAEQVRAHQSFSAR
jgi:hypothetical protein